MEREVTKGLFGVYNKLVDQYTKSLNFLDNQISHNLREGGIQTRNSKYNGLWCCFLIPTILFLYYLRGNVNELYTTVAFQSLGMLTYSILFIVFMSVSIEFVKDDCFGGSSASSMLSALLVYAFCNVGLVQALIMSFSSIYLYGYLLRQCVKSFPLTFTLGELMIVLQGFILFVDMLIYAIWYSFEDTDDVLVWSVLFSGYSALAFIIVALYYLTEERRTLKVFGQIMMTAAGIVLVSLNCWWGLTSIPYIILFIFFDLTRLTLLIQWAAMLLLAVGLIYMRTKEERKADSTVRKSFHVLASLVFTVGTLTDLHLMRLAAGIALGAIVFVEALRKSKIDPMSSALQSAFEVYRDEKDSGAFAVTPIYMYVGIACPLALVPDHFGAKLEYLSGVLSTGIGDSAASFFGKRYGSTYWPGSKKTVEGTAANIISQVVYVYVLITFNLLHEADDFLMLRTLLAATVSALIESRTVQVDNVVLPLATIIAFQLSAILVWPLT